MAVLLAQAAAGCVESGASDAGGARPNEAPVASGPASYDDETGGIDGLVTNAELVPLEGAVVGLLETPESEVATDASGRFSISRIAPGDYQLAVQKLGYESVGKKVSVVQGQIVQVQIALPELPVSGPYPELIIHKGIIRNGIGLVRTATCQNCGSRETYTEFPKGGLPDDFAGVMIESKWTARDYLGLDFNDRPGGKMYWRVRSPSPIHFLVELCENYVGKPHFGRQPMPCAPEDLDGNRIHVETWYIGDFQEQTHLLDPVCQTPTGPLPGYEAGCYGLGFMPELVFTNYLTIFHVEVPPEARTTYSAIPDG